LLDLPHFLPFLLMSLFLLDLPHFRIAIASPESMLLI
jgi:hypothetical protein